MKSILENICACFNSVFISSCVGIGTLDDFMALLTFLYSFIDTPQKHEPQDFWQIVNIALNKFKSAIPSPVFPSVINLKYYISVTRRMVKKVRTNLDSSNAAGPDCISLVVLKAYEP